jgi:hypothetical protein
MLKDGPVRTITYFDELLSDQKLRLEQRYSLSV